MGKAGQGFSKLRASSASFSMLMMEIESYACQRARQDGSCISSQFQKEVGSVFSCKNSNSFQPVRPRDASKTQARPEGVYHSLHSMSLIAQLFDPMRQNLRNSHLRILKVTFNGTKAAPCAKDHLPAFVSAAPCIRFVIKSSFGAPGLSGSIALEPIP